MTDVTKKVAMIAAATAFALVGTGQAAYASDIAFDFNSPALPTGSSVSSVATYMNNVLAGNGGGSVSVSGAGMNSSTQIVTNSYDGEGHVIYTSGNELTLGTTDGNGVLHGGANDNFIYTFTGSSVIMTFTGVSGVTGVSFEYEIFPNADCSDANTCGSNNVPDFTLKVNGSTKLHTLATDPAFHSHSPAETGSHYETDPQFGPTYVTIPFGFTTTNASFTIEFDDWPATIGFDDVHLLRSTPEPGSLLLLGTGLAAFFARRRLTKA